MRTRYRSFPALGLALVLALCPSSLVADPAGGNTLQSWADEVRGWGPQVPDWIVHSQPLDYAARRPAFDDAGQPILDAGGRHATNPARLSGRVFTPPSWRLPDGSSLPIVLYAHGTELRKEAVPSRFDGQEWPLGAAAAVSFGFMVAMPDLPGLGGDAARYHPYCHADSLAYALVDALPAARDQFLQDPFLVEHGYTWNGQVFLVGYSEGGYAALAAVKELEATAAKGQAPFALTGSACMAGPFDLSGTMRAAFIDPTTRYPRSYYLPYFVLGYHSVYGPRLDPRAVLAPGLLQTGPDGDLLTWMDGDLDGLVVDADLGARLGMPPEAIQLRSLFDPGWLAQELADPAYATSPVRALLADNDLCRGWTPTRPILFCQSPDDDLVPYANTITTLDQLGQAIQAAGGRPEDVLFSLPIGQAGDHISHTEGALIALPSAFAWIYYGMPDPALLAWLDW